MVGVSLSEFARGFSSFSECGIPVVSKPLKQEALWPFLLVRGF